MKILLLLTALFLFSTHVYSESLPKPWYQTNLEHYEAGVIKSNHPLRRHVGYLKSNVEKPSSGFVLQNISPREEWLGQRIKLTGLVKVNMIKGAANMFMTIDNGEGYRSHDSMENRRLKGITDWQPISIVMDMTFELNTYILFGVTLHGEGEIYFDDFKFEVVNYDVEVTGEVIERKPKRMPSNLSFEFGSNN